MSNGSHWEGHIEIEKPYLWDSQLPPCFMVYCIDTNLQQVKHYNYFLFLHFPVRFPRYLLSSGHLFSLQLVYLHWFCSLLRLTEENLTSVCDHVHSIPVDNTNTLQLAWFLYAVWLSLKSSRSIHFGGVAETNGWTTWSLYIILTVL